MRDEVLHLNLVVTTKVLTLLRLETHLCSSWYQCALNVYNTSTTCKRAFVRAVGDEQVRVCVRMRVPACLCVSLPLCVCVCVCRYEIISHQRCSSIDRVKFQVILYPSSAATKAFWPYESHFIYGRKRCFDLGESFDHNRCSAVFYCVRFNCCYSGSLSRMLLWASH